VLCSQLFVQLPLVTAMYYFMTYFETPYGSTPLDCQHIKPFREMSRPHLPIGRQEPLRLPLPLRVDYASIPAGWDLLWRCVLSFAIEASTLLM
jgi:hypothetical protein